MPTLALGHVLCIIQHDVISNTSGFNTVNDCCLLVIRIVISKWFPVVVLIVLFVDECCGVVRLSHETSLRRAATLVLFMVRLCSGFTLSNFRHVI